MGDELVMCGLVLDQHRDLGTVDWRWGEGDVLHHPLCISLAFRAVRWGIGLSERGGGSLVGRACLMWITTNNWRVVASSARHINYLIVHGLVWILVLEC